MAISLTDGFKNYQPGLTSLAQISTATGGGSASASGTADPNTLSLPTSVKSYDLHDLVTGVFLETFYRNTVTGVFE